MHFDATYDVCHENFLCDTLHDHTGVNRHAASRPVDGSCTKYGKIWTMSKFRRSSENHMMLYHNMCNCYITQSRLIPYQDIALGRLEEPTAGRTGKESDGIYETCKDGLSEY